MFNTIGWILIGICCFYLLRNIYAGYILYPIGGRMIEAAADLVPRDKRKLLYSHFTRRNYYLFVLNPLWWRLQDTFKNKMVREDMMQHAKNLGRIK